jgi:hypothetical protein
MACDKTKHTCREVSPGLPGLDAPRVAGSFQNPPRFARWVRETSSHPQCVQSRTHLPAIMFVILFHTCVKSGFLIGLEQVSLSSSSPAFCPNSPAFRRTHPRNCSRCNNNINKYGGQDLADKPRLYRTFFGDLHTETEEKPKKKCKKCNLDVDK